MERIGTVLIGPNTLMREGLNRILSAEDFHILASASSIEDLVAESIPREQAFLLIIDVSDIPGVSDDPGAAAQEVERFKTQYPAARIALLAGRHQASEIVSAVLAGANACFINVPTCDIFIKSIELVMLGTTILPPELLDLIVNRQNGSEGNDHNAHQESIVNHQQPGRDNDEGNDIDEPKAAQSIDGDNGELASDTSITPRLSERQKTILRCLLDGDSNKTIARRIDITEATVKVHVKMLLRKIRVHNRTQAAIWAMGHGQLISNKMGNNFIPEIPDHASTRADVPQALSEA